MTEEIPRVGSRASVFHGRSLQTPGGLKKKDLMMHKGRIVSRKKHEQGKKAIKRLFALGYRPKKGTFKLMRKSMAVSEKKKVGRRTRRR
jgi:hypothetical protein